MVTPPTSAATARGKVPESLDPKGVYLSRVLATESTRRAQTVRGNLVDQIMSLRQIIPHALWMVFLTAHPSTHLMLAPKVTDPGPNLARDWL